MSINAVINIQKTISSIGGSVVKSLKNAIESEIDNFSDKILVTVKKGYLDSHKYGTNWTVTEDWAKRRGLFSSAPLYWKGAVMRSITSDRPSVKIIGNIVEARIKVYPAKLSHPGGRVDTQYLANLHEGPVQKRSSGASTWPLWATIREQELPKLGNEFLKTVASRIG